MDNSILNYIIIVVGVLSWIVFVLGMNKLYKIHLELMRVNKELSINLTGINSNLKSTVTTVNEVNIEQRRTNKLLLELLNHFKQPVADDIVVEQHRNAD